MLTRLPAAVLFHMVDEGMHTAHVDELVGGSVAGMHTVAGVATGVIYKCTASPRVIALAGTIGGLGVAAYYAAKAAFPPFAKASRILH